MVPGDFIDGLVDGRRRPADAVRRTLLVLTCLLPLLGAGGCGTLMFPDRHGQRSGHLDPNVVILDGIGLIFFIVPGLVAYAVDFASGAIYLPPDVEKGEGPFIHDEPDEDPSPSEE